MSLDWRIETEAEEEPRGDAGSRGTAPAAPPPRGRPALRGALLVLAALGAVLLVALALRAWTNHRLLRQAEQDVRLAVELEERALVEGDEELYLRLQASERRRRLRARVADGPPPPLPGMRVAGAGEIVELRSFAPGFGQAGEIREAEVELRYAVSDTIGLGAFLERRAYLRDEEGAWLHAALDAIDGPEAEDEPLLEYQGDWIAARYLAADEADLLPALDAADEALARFCGARDCVPESLPVLRFTGERGAARRILSRRGRYLELPAPSRGLRPADEAAAALLARGLQRALLLALAEETGRFTWSPPGRERPPWHALREALLDAWLAEEGLAASPTVGAAEVPIGAGGLPASAWDLWVDWNPSEEDERVWRPRAARAFVQHLVAERGADPLRLLETMEAPESQGLRAWLALSLGEDAAREVATTWPGETTPWPAVTAILLQCWGASRGAPLTPEQFLFTPGATEPVLIGARLCGGDEASWAAWSPSGDVLAVQCRRVDEEGRAVEGAGAEASRLQLHDPEPPWALRETVETALSLRPWSAAFVGERRLRGQSEEGDAVLDLDAEPPELRAFGLAEPSWRGLGEAVWSGDGRYMARRETSGPSVDSASTRIALYDAADPPRPARLWRLPEGRIYPDRFLLAFHPDGERLLWATFLGREAEARLLMSVADTETGDVLERTLDEDTVASLSGGTATALDPRARLSLAGFPDEDAWLGLSAGLREDDAGPEGPGTLVLAWRLADDDLEARVVRAGAAAGWLPARHPLAEGRGPTMVIYEVPPPRTARRAEPIALFEPDAGGYEDLVAMPDDVSPDGRWLQRQSFGRFELRDGSGEPAWAFHAPACQPRWRGGRTASAGR